MCRIENRSRYKLGISLTQKGSYEHASGASENVLQDTPSEHHKTYFEK